MKGIQSRIDVGGVLHTGREIELRETLGLPDFGSYVFPAPLDVSLTIRRLGRGLDVHGTVIGSAQAVCARCVDDVTLHLDLAIDERIEPGTGADDPLGENNVLDGEHLDLQDLVRQVIDSALPLAVLCHDDCTGLCTTCGHKRDGSCRCAIPE